MSNRTAEEWVDVIRSAPSGSAPQPSLPQDRRRSIRALRAKGWSTATAALFLERRRWLRPGSAQRRHAERLALEGRQLSRPVGVRNGAAYGMEVASSAARERAEQAAALAVLAPLSVPQDDSAQWADLAPSRAAARRHAPDPPRLPCVAALIAAPAAPPAAACAAA